MPLEKLHRAEDRVWALWKIAETEDALHATVEKFEKIPEHTTHPRKRLEFLAGRVLVKHLMEEMGLAFRGVRKDAFGKPFLSESDWHVSLSHSFPYVAALIDRHQVTGIDLEQPKEKLLRIAPRVLSATELADAGDDVIKHCIYWSAKETLVKIHGKKDLVFADEMKISPFTRDIAGNLLGRIIAADRETRVYLQYIVQPDFVLVFNLRNES